MPSGTFLFTVCGFYRYNCIVAYLLKPDFLVLIKSNLKMLHDNGLCKSLA